MAKRLTRKQIKKEDVVKSTLLKFWEDIQTHPIRFTSIIILAAGILIISIAWKNYAIYKYDHAEQLLSQVLKEYNPIQQEENFSLSNNNILSSSNIANSSTINKLNTIIRDFPDTLYAQKALYYLSMIQIKNNNYDEAIINLQKSLKLSKNKIITDFSKFALSIAFSKKQEFSEAKEIIKSLINDPSCYIPKDYLLFQLASVYEQEGNISESKNYLRRVLNEFPSTTLRSLIDKKLKL